MSNFFKTAFAIASTKPEPQPLNGVFPLPPEVENEIPTLTSDTSDEKTSLSKEVKEDLKNIPNTFFDKVNNLIDGLDSDLKEQTEKDNEFTIEDDGKSFADCVKETKKPDMEFIPDVRPKAIHIDVIPKGKRKTH